MDNTLTDDDSRPERPDEAALGFLLEAAHRWIDECPRKAIELQESRASGIVGYDDRYLHIADAALVTALAERDVKRELEEEALEKAQMSGRPEDVV
jgi:hypothetical protein